MPGELLLDTGALVSLLDRSQRHHREFVGFFQTWQREAVTTEAVVTEATHLLARVSGGGVACLDFVLSGGAVLVVLAEDLKTNIVLTTDRRDFSVYRIDGRKRFEIPI
ncbi:MAG: hypothetical protein E6K25_15090 [Gammaproteobacteria bacterium]|nr:MAG: hypothetical protein E6K25_15090 [Gammaproteobacteria bacterium]